MCYHGVSVRLSIHLLSCVFCVLWWGGAGTKRRNGGRPSQWFWMNWKVFVNKIINLTFHPMAFVTPRLSIQIKEKHLFNFISPILTHSHSLFPFSLTITFKSQSLYIYLLSSLSSSLPLPRIVVVGMNSVLLIRVWQQRHTNVWLEINVRGHWDVTLDDQRIGAFAEWSSSGGRKVGSDRNLDHL